MFQISKTLEFAYGHRVHNQLLEPEFADDLKCACRHLHGHEGRVEITLTSKQGQPELTRGMVTDFRHLEVLKRFINDTIDHRFLIDSRDPMLSRLLAASESVRSDQFYIKDIEIRGKAVAGRVNLSEDTPEVDRDYLESFVIVNFVPTSENLSKWLFGIATHVMAPLARVVSVDWWETSKSHSLYVG